jgi:hypothetical protein
MDPPKLLKAFVKVHLTADQSTDDSLQVPRDNLRIWSQHWESGRGECSVLVGFSASDIRMVGNMVGNIDDIVKLKDTVCRHRASIGSCNGTTRGFKRLQRVMQSVLY